MFLENDNANRLPNMMVSEEKKIKSANNLLEEKQAVRLLNSAKKADEPMTAASDDSGIDTQATIQAAIDFNVIYDAGTVSAGQQLLLQLNTNADKKVVFHSSCGSSLNYRTRIFYIENNQVYIVQDSWPSLGDFDVDSFIAKGGIYYIQMDILSGSDKLQFLTVELDKYSDNEPCDNLYTALSLPVADKIEAHDFFDNRMDYDFFIMETAKDKLYLNFAYDNDNIMNPLRHNPMVGYLVLLWNDNGVKQVDAGSLSAMTLDKEPALEVAGKYIFILYPLDALPAGQLEEAYKFAVREERTAISTLPEKQVFHISTVQGQIDAGTFDTFQGRTCPFWINGKSVCLSGIVENWDGIAKQVVIQVEDDYDNVNTTIGIINASGSYSFVIPLFAKEEADAKSFYYHGENMHWNTVEFFDEYGKASATFLRLTGTYKELLNIATCYNTAPLNH